MGTLYAQIPFSPNLPFSPSTPGEGDLAHATDNSGRAPFWSVASMLSMASVMAMMRIRHEFQLLTLIRCGLPCALVAEHCHVCFFAAALDDRSELVALAVDIVARTA